MIHHRLLSAVLITALCASALSAEVVADNGAEVVRLMDTPCLGKFVADDVRSEYRTATSKIGDKQYAACWTTKGGVAVFVKYDDGDEATILMSSFKREEGV